eukprot:405371-Pleurochrysis_carterae.AAC.1
MAPEATIMRARARSQASDMHLPFTCPVTHMIDIFQLEQVRHRWVRAEKSGQECSVFVMRRSGYCGIRNLQMHATWLLRCSILAPSRKSLRRLRSDACLCNKEPRGGTVYKAVEHHHAPSRLLRMHAA